MLISSDQLLCHLIGDYVLQSDWMAGNKTKRFLPAACHAISYAVPFLFMGPSLRALACIVVTHFFIDRYRLARYVVWAKNFFAPPGNNQRWSECSATGYPPDRPAWMAVWLLIIADNILHIAINGIAMKFL